MFIIDKNDSPTDKGLKFDAAVKDMLQALPAGWEVFLTPDGDQQTSAALRVRGNHRLVIVGDERRVLSFGPVFLTDLPEEEAFSGFTPAEVDLVMNKLGYLHACVQAGCHVHSQLTMHVKHERPTIDARGAKVSPLPPRAPVVSMGM